MAVAMATAVAMAMAIIRAKIVVPLVEILVNALYLFDKLSNIKHLALVIC